MNKEVLQAKVSFHRTCMFVLLLLDLIVLLAWGTNITGSFNRMAFFIASIALLVIFLGSMVFYIKRNKQLVKSLK